MDEEGRRLANMSDAEWDRHIAALMRRAEEDRRPTRPRLLSRSTWLAVAGVVVLVVTGLATLLVTRHHDAGSAVSSGAQVVPDRTYRPGPPFAGTPAAAWQPATVALHLPDASQVGPYSEKVVAGALRRARSYLLAARADDRVLRHHELSVLSRLATAQVPATPDSLYAAELAAGNTLAAPVRMRGKATVVYTPAEGRYGPHLTVSANLLWAYALRAGYAVDPVSDGVVVKHDEIQLGFYLDRDGDGPHAKVVPQQDESLTIDGDCGYAHDGLLGLPRTDDPRRSVGGDDHTKYDLDAGVSSSGGCRD